jgi:alkanesulfonate monooxygenase SsuD/methylene tetrahydromethanopterin reductase-like flavin-dependent oxidoreductase (luciferase family)
VRQVLAREKPVTNDGPHYPLPYPGGMGLGKPLKSIVHPLRADIPIILGAEGPKNVALAAEIADGWFPIFFSPKAMSSFERSLDEGFARPGARAPPRTSRCWPSSHGHERRRRGRRPTGSGPCSPSTSAAWGPRR